MMNFMGGGDLHGFYDEDRLNVKGKVSSSSWTKNNLVPLVWLGSSNSPDDASTTPIRSFNEGAAAASTTSTQLELMMDSSPRNNSTTAAGEDDDQHTAPAAANGDDNYQNDDRVNMDRTEGNSPIALGVGSSSSLMMMIEREHMFDKVVTPSDVGKLNRLVIPKQHAERYFPLDSSANEKGLLLNFEDRNGKAWRFRYSYWNSSQSYVMTKGWSRFVKEKKLDAGDVVSFQRGVGDLHKDRLFIDWRRRPDAPDLVAPPIPSFHLPYHRSFGGHWNPLLFQSQGAISPLPPGQGRDQMMHPNPSSIQSHLTSYHGGNHYGYSTGMPCSGSVIYLRSAAAGAPQQAGMLQLQRRGVGGVEPVVFESVPVVHGKAAAKRLRLFGVNMDCPIPEQTDECDVVLSSTATPHSAIPPPQLSSPSSSIPPHRNHIPFYNGNTNFLKKSKSSMSLDLDI